MSIAYEWYIDYQNQLIVHSNLVVFYTGTGGFTIGETVTWSAGAQSAKVVYENTTDNILILAYNTNTPTGTITGSSSGSTATYGDSTSLQSATFSYDGGTGGWSVGDRVTIGTATATVVSDDTANDILVVKYIDGTIADNDAISGGAGGELVNGTPQFSNTTYSVRQLYSFLQDTFDELGQMDDTVPMSAQTPTEFTLINDWFIDDESTKYLSGGAIQSSGWNNVIDVLTLDGSYTNAVPTDIGKTVLDDAVSAGTLLHYNNTQQKWWVRTNSVTRIADNSAMTISTGTGVGTAAGDSNTGDTLYANIYTLGTIQTTPNPKTYVFQESLALNEWWGRGDSEAHIDVLIKVKEASVEIDGAQITVFVRHYGDLYDHFPIDLSSGGRNAVPLATQEDLNNNVTGEITVAYSGQSGSWTVGNFVRDTTTGAYGEILADDDQGATGTLTIGNVIAGTAGSFDFTATNTLQETIDGTANGDVTGVSATAGTVTAVVRDYNDIGIYFVNLSIPFNSGSEEPSLGDRIEGAGSGAVAYYVGSTITSGSWTGGDAAGTIYLANWVDTTNFGNPENLDIDGGTANFATTAGAQSIAKTVDKAFEQGTDYPYNVIVDCAARPMSEVYEWFKYVTREDANSTAPAGFNHITMYRVNDAGTAIIEEEGEEYISAQTTYTPVKASPFGTFAGGKLFGARGVWVENMDNADRQNFQLIDADGATQTPPNFITITVNSVVVGDKVTIFRTDGGEDIDKDQFTSHATNNTLGSGTFEVTTPIPSDTPSSGYLRIVDTSDTSTEREERIAYTSWTNSLGGPYVFTLSGTLAKTYGNTDTAYVPYYDEVAGATSVSVTVIYNVNQSVLTRVRQYDGGTPANSILPFQITGTVTISGYTVAAIRTPDTIVSTY